MVRKEHEKIEDLLVELIEEAKPILEAEPDVQKKYLKLMDEMNEKRKASREIFNQKIDNIYKSSSFLDIRNAITTVFVIISLLFVNNSILNNKQDLVMLALNMASTYIIMFVCTMGLLNILNKKKRTVLTKLEKQYELEKADLMNDKNHEDIELFRHLSLHNDKAAKKAMLYSALTIFSPFPIVGGLILWIEYIIRLDSNVIYLHLFVIGALVWLLTSDSMGAIKVLFEEIKFKKEHKRITKQYDLLLNKILNKG